MKCPCEMTPFNVPHKHSPECPCARRGFEGADGQGHSTDPAWLGWLLPSALTTTLPGYPECCQGTPSAARAPQMMPGHPEYCQGTSSAARAPQVLSVYPRCCLRTARMKTIPQWDDGDPIPSREEQPLMDSWASSS